MSNLNEFKDGDKVYCPTLGKGVYTLDISLSGDDFIVRADNGTYLDVNENGRYLNSDLLPHIFHVTEENRKKLEDLYGVEFEKPKRKLKGSELCKYLLKTKPHVFCFVSDVSDSSYRLFRKVEIIFSFSEERERFVTLTNFDWKYAVPIDPETLQPLEIEVDDE